jgi:glycosyltransferase involved in cell wall biosynthesis
MSNKTKPSVSVIVPIYNSQDHLQECLDSVFAQSFADYELLIIDDGSQDGSADIARRNAENRKNVNIIKQQNHGQGYARNRALEQARGTYILFVDSDDFVEPDLLDVVVTRAHRERADVIHYNWQMLDNNRQGKEETTYFNKERFATKPLLQGDECERYLEKNNYFVWDALYSKRFLDQHDIRFGEGYIYEDNEFIVEVASHAQRIAIIDRPLYTMRRNNVSSSRSQYDTDRHFREFMLAMRRSFEVLVPRTPHASFYLAAYFLEKFIIYYQRRIPAPYLWPYLCEFVDILHDQNLITPNGHEYKFLRSCVQHNIFTKRRYQLFWLGVQYKTRILPLKDRFYSQRSTQVK